MARKDDANGHREVERMSRLILGVFLPNVYHNLLPNCYQKFQIIFPIQPDQNTLRTHFCARFCP